MRGKSDPSRVAERDRRAAGPGDRVAPRDCADAGLGPPARTGGGQASGTTECSRCGRGRRPRRWRRAGRTGDRFAGGAGRPRRRSAQGGLRLDSAPNPWHNSGDWLGLSELETVTRVRLHSGPSPPRLSPSLRYPNEPSLARPGAVDAAAPVDAADRAHRSLQNRADAVSHSPHSHRRHPHHQEPEECAHQARHTDNCRELIRSQ